MKIQSFLIVLFISIIFSCCKDKEKEKVKEVQLMSIKVVDSLPELPPPPLIPTHIYAEGILSGKIKPGDNAETENCLDSTMSENPATRKFYFKILRKIAKGSDGALTEMVCSYSKSLFQKYPYEFISFYQTFSETEQSSFVEFIAYEFGDSDNYINDINRYFTAIGEACKECNETDRRIIKIIKYGIIESVKEQFD